jgi:hypothetical protein
MEGPCCSNFDGAAKVKKYLRLGQVTAGTSGDRYVQGLREAIEWVDSPERATADCRPAIDVTRQKLRDQLGIETTLVEIPDRNLMESKWVICREQG